MRATMSTSKVYCLVITHDNTISGSMFLVHVGLNEGVGELKKKIALSLAPTDPYYSRHLKVYRCEGTTFDDEDEQNLQNQVNEAFSSAGTARLFGVRGILAEIPTAETLLVKMSSISNLLSMRQRSE
jgi:hypothetical protein